MQAITATTWAANRIDIFYLDGYSLEHQAWDGTHWAGENPLGRPDPLGGFFATVPVAVQALVPEPTLTNPLPGPAMGPASTGPSTSVSGSDVTGTESSASPASLKAAAAGSSATSLDTAITDASGTPISVARISPGLPGLVGGLSAPKANRVDVFGVGSDFSMYHQTLWNGVPPGTPGVFDNLGGSFLSAPAAIAWQSARVDVFGVGSDRAMWQRTLTGEQWSPAWVSLGGSFSSEASVVSWASNQLDIFARGSDFTLRHRAYDGVNFLTDWENLGQSLASAPAAVSWGPNRLDVFAIANDGSLIHRWWDGSIWNDWETLPIPATASPITFVSAPAVTTSGPEVLDVFVVGSDGNLYHYWWQAMAWGEPASLGGDIAGTPLALLPAPGQIFLMKPTNEGSVAQQFITEGSGGATAWTPVTANVHLPTRYNFSVDFVKVDKTRSTTTDTDTSQSSVSPGNWPAQSAVQFLGTLGGTSPSEAQTNLLDFQPVAVELGEFAIFNYQIVNKGSPDPNVVGPALASAGNSLASQALQSIVKQLASGVTKIATVAIGTASGVPVLGSILGVIGSWLVGQLTAIIFADCDGLVAVEQVVIAGSDLFNKTASGPYTTTTIHPGTDSPAGCGPNSKYEVTWSITRV